MAGSLGKEIYIKEKMSPPTVPEIKAVYDMLQKLAIDVVVHPKAYLDKTLSNKATYAILLITGGIQVAGAFALGEIIGRFHIYGYKKNH